MISSFRPSTLIVQTQPTDPPRDIIFIHNPNDRVRMFSRNPFPFSHTHGTLNTFQPNITVPQLSTPPQPNLPTPVRILKKAPGSRESQAILRAARLARSSSAQSSNSSLAFTPY